MATRSFPSAVASSGVLESLFLLDFSGCEGPLHAERPNIGDRERLLARINDMVDSRWLTKQGWTRRARKQNGGSL